MSDTSERYERKPSQRDVDGCERRRGITVPDGWRLVPCEPTPEMVDAACLGWVISERERRKRIKVYRAMVEAVGNAPRHGAEVARLP